MRKFLVKDMDTVIEVESCSRKEILNDTKYFIEMLKDYEECENFGIEDSVNIQILYNDGTEDAYIDSDYDWRIPIRKINIDTIIYQDAWETKCFGNFEINEYGVVTAERYEDIIAEENIEEIF